MLVLNYELFRVLTEDPDDRPAKRGRKAAQQQAEPSKPASKREKKLEKMKPQLRRYLQDPGEFGRVGSLNIHQTTVRVLQAPIS